MENKKAEVVDILSADTMMTEKVNCLAGGSKNEPEIDQKKPDVKMEHEDPGNKQEGSEGRSCPEKMASETHMEEPICLIQNTTSGSLQLNPLAVEILHGITQPVVVMAIVGLYRTGKSFLMNTVAGKKKGFSLGSTIQSHTKGIWMWCMPHPEKLDHTLVLLDTEGLGDVEKGDLNYDTWIFTLAVLLSSTLVYNTKGTIDQDAMNKLHYVSELTKHIKVKALENEEEDSAADAEYVSFFPDFIWTVRDFTLDLELDGKPVTEDEYLERALTLKKGRSKEVLEYNVPRQCIRDYFPTRKCFMFIRPASERDMKNLELLPDSAFNPEFLEQSQRFCQYVLCESKVKMLKGGHHISGRMFGMLAQSYVESICNGKVPCLENTVTVLATIENEAAIKEGLTHYKAQMEKCVTFPEELSVLSETHGNCEKVALQLFMQRSFKDEDQQYQKKLMVQINEHYKTVQDKNKTTSEEICQKLLSQLSANMEMKLRDGTYMQPGGYEVYVKDQKQVMENFQRTSNKGIMAEQVLEEFMNSKKAEAASILNFDKILTDAEMRQAANQAKMEEMEKQCKAEEEKRQQMEQQMRDLERSHQEIMCQMNTKMKDEVVKLRKEMERAVQCKLREQEKMLQQGFRKEAERMKEEIDMLQEKGKEQEEKLQQELLKRGEEMKKEMEKLQKEGKERVEKFEKQLKEEKEKQHQQEMEEKEKMRQHEREEREKQRQHEREENEKQRQHEEQQQEREDKEKQRQHDDRQQEREEREKQRQHEREENEKQRQHERRERANQRQHEKDQNKCILS